MNAVALLIVLLCALVGYWILGLLGLIIGLLVGLLLAGAARV